jgi:hypothetical protein
MLQHNTHQSTKNVKMSTAASAASAAPAAFASAMVLVAPGVACCCHLVQRCHHDAVQQGIGSSELPGLTSFPVTLALVLKHCFLLYTRILTAPNLHRLLSTAGHIPIAPCHV